MRFYTIERDKYIMIHLGIRINDEHYAYAFQKVLMKECNKRFQLQEC